MSLLHLGWQWFRRRPVLIAAAGGLALGVAVLFTVLAVFNGFLGALQSSIRDFAGDVVVQVPKRSERPLADYLEPVRAVPGVASVHPRAVAFGMVGRRGARAVADLRTADLTGLVVVGIDPDEAPALGADPALFAEPSQPLRPPPGDDDVARAAPSPPLVLGRALAARLGLEVGDVLEVVGFSGGEPRRASFRLAATFATGRFDQEMDRALARRADVARLADRPRGFSDLVVRAAPGVDAAELAARIEQALASASLAPQERPRVRTWRDLGGQLLRAAEDQRGLLGTVFFLIVLVAAYQLLATLLLTVTEKKRDLGVLRALGATPLRVVSFFVGLAAVVGAVGIAVGLALGAWLVHDIHRVELLLGGGKPIFLPEVYHFTEIPTDVDPASTLVLVTATFAATLLFALVPALRATRVPILRALFGR